MNILTVVIVMLMTFAVITTARVESFLSQHRRHVVLSRHVELAEQVASHSRAKTVYDDCKVRVTVKLEEDEEESPKVEKLSRKFNIRHFLQLDSSNVGATGDLLASLLNELYGNEPFFLEIQENRPDAINELLQQIQAAAQVEKVTSMERLAELKIEDDLQLLLYKILHGAQNLSGRGYPPLKQFATISTGDKKISLYLAEKELLSAIFPQDLVGEVQQLRLELYSQLKAGGDSKEIAHHFATRLESAVPAQWRDLVTFDVSKTKPPDKKP